MTKNDPELLAYYERKIRRGFPSGEVHAELLDKGYSMEEANEFIQLLQQQSLQKNPNRSNEFRMIIAVVLIILGLIQLSSNSKIGFGFIASGLIKLCVDMYAHINKEKDAS